MIGDAVTQGQKAVGKVNVFKLNIRIGAGHVPYTHLTLQTSELV